MHLGNLIGAAPDSFITATAIENAFYDLYRRLNLLLAQFGGCSEDVLFELSFCLSLSGSQIWDLDVSCMEKMHVFIAWRKCVRRLHGLYRIPGSTHCVLVLVICDDLAIDKQKIKGS